MDEKSDTGCADCLEPDNVALGDCDDGFNDPAVDYTIGNGWVGRRSSGEHYTVHDGGQTVTIHCSPWATATSDDETDSWDCWVTYSVSVAPESLTLNYSTNKKVPDLDSSGVQTVDDNGDPNYKAVPNPFIGEGDTIFSYHSFTDTQGGEGSPPYVDVPAENWIVFSPYFIGDWHWKTGESHGGQTEDVPDVVTPDTWSWSPDESEDTWDYGKCEMPWATNFDFEKEIPRGRIRRRHTTFPTQPLITLMAHQPPPTM